MVEWYGRLPGEAGVSGYVYLGSPGARSNVHSGNAGLEVAKGAEGPNGTVVFSSTKSLYVRVQTRSCPVPPWVVVGVAEAGKSGGWEGDQLRRASAGRCVSASAVQAAEIRTAATVAATIKNSIKLRNPVKNVYL